MIINKVNHPKKNIKVSRGKPASAKVNHRGLLVVLSSPSGGGKTTVCRRLLRKNPEYVYSVSMTTRSPRRGEREGTHYKFVDQAQFQRLVVAERLAEYATVHGELYGTPKQNIREALALRRVILFDLDVVGGLALKREYSETVLIFLVPPSWEVLRDRLIGRKTETAVVRRRRLARARRELPFWRSYDYAVPNDKLADCVHDCQAIIRAERLRAIRAPKFAQGRKLPIGKLED